MKTDQGPGPRTVSDRQRKTPAWRYARGIAILVSGWLVISAQGYEAWAANRTTVATASGPAK